LKAEVYQPCIPFPLNCMRLSQLHQTLPRQSETFKLLEAV